MNNNWYVHGVTTRKGSKEGDLNVYDVLVVDAQSNNIIHAFYQMLDGVDSCCNVDFLLLESYFAYYFFCFMRVHV